MRGGAGLWVALSLIIPHIPGHVAPMHPVPEGRRFLTLGLGELEWVGPGVPPGLGSVA